MNSISTSRKDRRLPRLRFSLLTLILFVLLIASAGLLWWNWGPWVIDRTILEDGPVKDIQFSKDFSKLLTHCVVPIFGDEIETEQSVVTLRDVNSGKLLNRWKNKITENAQLYFSRSGDYVEDIASYPNGNVAHSLRWNVANAQRIDFSKAAPDKTTYWPTVSDDDRFAIVNFGDEFTLVRLPELAVVFSQKGRGFFLSGTQVAALIDGKARFISIETGKTELEFPIPKLNKPIVVSPCTGRVLIFEREGDLTGLKTVLYDTATGKELLNLDEDFAYLAGEDSDLWMCTSCFDQSNGGKAVFRMRNLNTPAKLVQFHGDIIFMLSQHYVSCAESPCKVWDIGTGRLQWESNDYDMLNSSENGSCAIAFLNGKPICIVNIEDGKVLMNLETVRHPKFSHSSKTLVAWLENGVDFLTYDADHPQILFWKKVRPEQWYGVAWLPEFWLTVLLAASFIWSLRRHRVAQRKLKSKAEGPATLPV